MKTTLRLSAIATMFLSTFFLNADAQSRRTDQDKNIIEDLMKTKRLQFLESTPENLFNELA